MPGGGRSRDPSPPSAISGGKKLNSGGSGHPVAISANHASKKVIVTALSANATEVYVGGSDVSAVGGSENGVLLNPTGSATFEIDNVSKVYIDAVTSGDGVSFIYLS